MRVIMYLLMIVSTSVAIYSFYMVNKKWKELNFKLKESKPSLKKEAHANSYSEQYLAHEAKGELDMLPNDLKNLLDKTYLMLVYLDRRVNQLSSENLIEFKKIKDKIFIETLGLITASYKNASSFSMQDQLSQLELSSNSLQLILDKLTKIVDSLTENNMQKLKVNDRYLQQSLNTKSSIDS